MGLPGTATRDVDAATRDVVVNCSVIVAILAVTPWTYAKRQYVVAKGDRWR